MQPLPVGRRLLPQIVDELATTDPDGVWLSMPVSPDSADSFYDVSYSQLANAVNRASWWLHDTIGTSDHGPLTLAYLGPTDSRYLILIIAAVKVGHRLLLPSSRNASVTQRKLLEATRCGILLYAEGERSKIDEIFETSPTGSYSHRVCEVPEQHLMIDIQPARSFAYSRVFAKERRNAFVILHTSGTSGDVEPIELPHSYYAYEDTVRDDLTKDGVLTFAPLKPGVRCLYTGPLYHAGAILFTLMKGLLLKVTMILPPARVPVTADVVESCLMNGRAAMLGTAPSVLEDLCSNVAGRKGLEKLQCIFCGSGPMPKAVGDALRSIDVDLLHIYGSTETALLPQLPLDNPVKDWQYFRFHPISGVSFVAVGKAGLYELVIERLSGKTIQPCFEVFPDIDEFHTNDTFSAHPSKRGLWKFEGRIDDIITLTNGEKFCASPAEDLLASHPDVANALIVGQGRLQPMLVLSLHDRKKDIDHMVDGLWPLVEEVNLQLPNYARIVRAFILVSSQPFLRTPKGTVRRHATEELLQPDIMAVYEQAQYSLADCYTMPDTLCKESLQTFLDQIISTRIIAGRHLEIDMDLFDHGLDSLRVAELVSIVNLFLKESSETRDWIHKRIRSQIVYQNRSISKLAGALYAMSTTQDALAADRQAWKKDHQLLLDRHTRNLPTPLEARMIGTSIKPPMRAVMLTGSTGSLGKHLLHALLQNSETDHIYCLDRSRDARTSYLETFSGDDHKLSRVTFLHVHCLDAKDLGVVDDLIYANMLEHVSTIIHSAWPVNFNIPLRSPATSEGGQHASFGSHIAGVRRLIDFAVVSRRRPQLVFISSLSSVLRFKDAKSGCIPEDVVDDPLAPSDDGYGRSKWLAERMLNMAAKSGGSTVRFKIIRLGQIAGSSPRLMTHHDSGSTWPENEMIPSMIRSSTTIKALPSSLYAMEKLRWIAVDDAAQIVLEIAIAEGGMEHTTASGAVTFNVTNIHEDGAENTWRDSMLPVVRARLEAVTGAEVEVVPMQEWLGRVERRGISVSGWQGETHNPAIKLISSYEDLVGVSIHSGLGDAIETSRARWASSTLRTLQLVSPAWMEAWMATWGL